jgi:DNA-binding PadR family transcriptional regulator
MIINLQVAAVYDVPNPLSDKGCLAGEKFRQPEKMATDMPLPEMSLPEMSLPEMSLPEWLVLAVLSQEPAHGFAVAQLTAPHGDLGRIWQVSKAVVYRAIRRLMDAGLIAPEGTEPGLGPQRTVYTATDDGRSVGRRRVAASARRARPRTPFRAAAQAGAARPGGHRPGGAAEQAAGGP